jgi:tetratricopeptide (TPR) repeat protein
MKRFTSNPTFLLLAAGFGLFAVLAYFQGRETSPPAQDWQPVADVAPPPSADNVDPTFHARLMRLREQLETAPEDTTALLELARLEQDAHQHDHSAEHYERFLALSPRNHQVWLDLANVYAGQGLWDEARDASERMLEHYPDDPSAMYNLGAIFANQGQAEEAKRWWTAVQKSDDARLGEQATNSLAQLAGVQAASATPRPVSSRSASAASRPANPHTASLHQPVVAHQLSRLSSAE